MKVYVERLKELAQRSELMWMSAIEGAAADDAAELRMGDRRETWVRQAASSSADAWGVAVAAAADGRYADAAELIGGAHSLALAYGDSGPEDEALALLRAAQEREGRRRDAASHAMRRLLVRLGQMCWDAQIELSIAAQVLRPADVDAYVLVDRNAHTAHSAVLDALGDYVAFGREPLGALASRIDGLARQGDVGLRMAAAIAAAREQLVAELAPEHAAEPAANLAAV